MEHKTALSEAREFMTQNTQIVKIMIGACREDLNSDSAICA